MLGAPASGHCSPSPRVAIELHPPAAAAAVPRLRSGTRRVAATCPPSEGVNIRFGAKVPGRSFDVRTASLDFAYGEGPFAHDTGCTSAGEVQGPACLATNSPSQDLGGAGD
jgi:hypothetical protein